MSWNLRHGNALTAQHAVVERTEKKHSFMYYCGTRRETVVVDMYYLLRGKSSHISLHAQNVVKQWACNDSGLGQFTLCLTSVLLGQLTLCLTSVLLGSVFIILQVKQCCPHDTPSCTDAGLQHFLEQARCLAVLGVHGCQELSAAGLRQLLDFRGLQEIEVERSTLRRLPVRELSAQHCYVSGDGFEPDEIYSGTSDTEDFSRFEDLLRRMERDGDA